MGMESLSAISGMRTYLLRAHGQDLYEVTPEPLSSKYPFD